eukprot:g4240.t1
MFVAREPTRKEQESTREFKKFRFLQNAAFVAMRNGKEELAAYLGYKALRYAAEYGLKLTMQIRNKQCGRCGVPKLGTVLTCSATDPVTKELSSSSHTSDTTQICKFCGNAKSFKKSLNKVNKAPKCKIQISYRNVFGL